MTRPLLPFHCGARWRDDAASEVSEKPLGERCNREPASGGVVPVKSREG
ncbi:hypothetical protein ZOD2009_16593 [Haladaptatus paucihalophilus DX253]|uniref:Uncharacterized protein n=1 Tax=Haladaptatus paucihalophilus DX253 TaxID=797209 RepID=E7QWY0_HALPU|nr:hypothetical protein [Haladaptatus paucihalophilus]EFW90783.1 hypothetical protein ZOD2009_16593 [Haladaptatus paucihalophilus DX253]